jgi:signal transduction histidine kinase
MERSHAEVVEAKRRLAEGREQERLHLARELHDGPVQDLYSANLQLRVASQNLNANGTLTPVEATLQRVSGSLRAICGELRPPALGPFGLAAALRSHVETLRAAHPALAFDLALAHDGQRLPEDVRLALFRIAQEALSNAARHARARAVRVAFTMDAEEAVLEVRDDGRGFRPPARPLEGARSGRFGLLGMTERAEAIGGRLDVRSAPGAGTTVRVAVPLPAGAAEPAAPAPEVDPG